jgi:hypothetical protein
MAKRGRKPKNGGNTKVSMVMAEITGNRNLNKLTPTQQAQQDQKVESPTKKQNKKEEETQAPEEQPEENKVWKLVRLVQSPSKEKVSCRTDGCSGKAVAVWAANPEDERPACLECQETEFGGFPEGIEPDNGDRGNVDDPKETEESKELSIESNKTAEDQDTTKGGSEVPKTPSPEVKPPSENSSESHDTEDFPKDHQETGMDKASDSSSAPVDNVETAVAAAPSKETNEANDVEQGSAKETLPDETEAELPEKETAQTSRSGQQENGSIQQVEGATSSDDSDKHSEQEEDGGEQVEVWEVTKVLSIQDLKKKGRPIVCSTESCNTPAAVVYKSSLKPNKNWYSCLDCQVSAIPLESKLFLLVLNKYILCSHSNRNQSLADGLR